MHSTPSLLGLAWTVTLQALVLSLALAGCQNRSDSSTIRAVVGTDDATGKRSALALLPLRNYTASRVDASSSDPTLAKQAAAMVTGRLMGLVECLDVVQASGKPVSAANLIEFAEARAELDDLYVDADRNLLTSRNVDQLIDFGRADGQAAKLPCRIYGERLVSFGVLSDLQIRMAGLPATLPGDAAKAAVIRNVFLLGQSVHLALRSSRLKGGDVLSAAGAQAILDMARDQGLKTQDAGAIRANFAAADRLYNPCLPKLAANARLAYTGAWKDAHFACESAGDARGIAHYRVGGAAGASYTAVRGMLANEIARTHRLIYAETATTSPALQQLWDVITSTRTWTSRSDSQLARYLASGEQGGLATLLEPTALRLADVSTVGNAQQTSSKRPLRQRVVGVEHRAGVKWTATSAAQRPRTIQERKARRGVDAN